ncbi:hypothetical protein PSQ90_16595 [Devosia rhodophyticola]|uniref:Carboxyltransferase domain-containing protein n=1 Tax=Devosia rhodophyticola TaxID=3026423 RepID=A0ABY7YX68_9HYPH|nr:hypothetical protein [Devosia rhodophyticola]WDR05836.1 hypothetical protein PSQ90_16595 [Devosia rhodophyticola]
MSAVIQIERAGPMTTVQDTGRRNALNHGVSASGPMDQSGFACAAAEITTSGRSGIEFTTSGVALRLLSGNLKIGGAGGKFFAQLNGAFLQWPLNRELVDGDVLDITPGPTGNFGYLRFDREMDIPLIMGSSATNTRAGLGGFEGRSLKADDQLSFTGKGESAPAPYHINPERSDPIRFIWGIHADLFDHDVRQNFVTTPFQVSGQMDRMGIKLNDARPVFAAGDNLVLVSDPVAPGDIQILGDGTPIVLMRDHQPTGGTHALPPF